VKSGKIPVVRTAPEPSEFSRIVSVETIDRHGLELELEAEPGECAALARRFGLEEVTRLTVSARLTPLPDREIRLVVTFCADVVQLCVITLEPVAVSLSERFEVVYAPRSEAVEEGEVVWVESETSARPLKHRARHFVLATGGILGGGIETNGNGRVWESIFDLPLTMPQQRSNWFRASFLNPQGHPLFNGGVRVNGRFQPVKLDGTAVYNNLWAVGNTLANCDPIQERSLEGIGIITGLTAGKAVAEQLKISLPE